ncbi:Translation initiation factor IF-2 [Balamuthia mandrillaris]
MEDDTTEAFRESVDAYVRVSRAAIEAQVEMVGLQANLLRRFSSPPPWFVAFEKEWKQREAERDAREAERDAREAKREKRDNKRWRALLQASQNNFNLLAEVLAEEEESEEDSEEESYTREDLDRMSYQQLRERATKASLKVKGKKKTDYVEALVAHYEEQQGEQLDEEN